MPRVLRSVTIRRVATVQGAADGLARALRPHLHVRPYRDAGRWELTGPNSASNTDAGSGTPGSNNPGTGGVDASPGPNPGSSASDSGSGARLFADAPSSGPSGAAGCGPPAAAFCETFDAPASARGRAGDLDKNF